MKKLFLSVLLALVASAMARGDAITIFNTGVDNSNALLPEGSTDPHYTLVSGPIVGATFVGMNQNTEPYIHEDGISRWINPTMDATDSDPAGVYTYTTTFSLPAGFTNASLSGQWLSDNEASMTINGGMTPVSMTPNSAASFQSWTPFSITSGFVEGVNTLEFAVTNDQVSPTALRVEIAGSFTPAAVPEPSTWGSLLGGGLVILGVCANRL